MNLDSPIRNEAFRGPGSLEGPDRAKNFSVSGESGPSFSEVISDALNDVQRLQSNADQAIQKLATGEIQDVHQVMVAFEQARLSMQMLVEVRNRLVEAYQEVSRMPM